MTYYASYDVLHQKSTAYESQHDLSTITKDGGNIISYTEVSPGQDHVRGTQLKRFWLRGIVAVAGPIVVGLYFIILWQLYLPQSDSNSPLTFGRPGATWVFYSWFLAGIIGLNLSVYGLTGVEASMLMDRFWHVRDGTSFMLHADNTWSGPGGWIKVIKWTIKLRKDGRGRAPPRLWFVLAIPSIFVFIAWPLSGLTMELTPGFHHGSRNNGSVVTGFSYDAFNERLGGDAETGALMTWQNALDAAVPRAGIIYTAEDYDRSKSPVFDKLPNVLPRKDGVTRFFLTAQAETPVEGVQWGLMMQYNCSVITKLEDFRILSLRNETAALYANTSSQTNYLVRNTTQQITILNQTDTSWVNNIFAVAEIGVDLFPSMDVYTNLGRDTLSGYGVPPQCSCYFNKAENVTGDYPGIDQEQIFEIALWQKLTNVSYGDVSAQDAPQYNFTIDHNITELYGAYDWRDFSNIAPSYRNMTGFDKPIPMTAIGVQCKVASSVGTAQIDGVRSTYSDFKRTDTPINLQRERCAYRLQARTPLSYIFQKYEYNWLPYLFASTAAPPPFYAPYTTDPTSSDVNTGYTVQLSYLQADQLRQSMLHAYASYAVQLMYNGGQGFTARKGSILTSLNPNITEFKPGTVLKQGVVSPVVPFVFFLIWIITSCTLGIMYGFQRRFAESLDGHTAFRLGVELSPDAKRELVKTPSTMEIDECIALDRVPGLVGDMQAQQIRGRIGLVRSAVAKKDKLYE